MILEKFLDFKGQLLNDFNGMLEHYLDCNGENWFKFLSKYELDENGFIHKENSFLFKISKPNLIRFLNSEVGVKDLIENSDEKFLVSIMEDSIAFETKFDFIGVDFIFDENEASAHGIEMKNMWNIYKEQFEFI